MQQQTEVSEETAGTLDTLECIVHDQTGVPGQNGVSG